MVANNIAFPFRVSDCVSFTFLFRSFCYAQDLINALLVSARKCIPCRSVSTHQKLAGWSKKVQVLKKACTFWSRVWSEAGCPNSGVLSQIKKIPDLVSSMKCVA